MVVGMKKQHGNKNQDCQWRELQNINNFINIQRPARLKVAVSVHIGVVT